MDATDSSPRRTSSIIRRFSSIERSRLPPRVSVCFASSSVDVSISSPKWTRTPCPSLRTHHRRMRCQGSDGGDRTLTEQVQLLTDEWLISYNHERPHESLGRVPPLTYLPRSTTFGDSSYRLST